MEDQPCVLGLDLSLTGTGVACGNAIVVDPFTILTDDKDGDRRLLVIRDRIHEQLWRARPDFCLMEDLPVHASMAGINGMIQGIVRIGLQELGIPYALVVPATLKKYATGKGNADKSDMRMALFKRTGLTVDLDDDNQVDAVWLMSMGLDLLGALPLAPVPQSQRQSLIGKGVRWPKGIPVPDGIVTEIKAGSGDAA
jgi:Holliday junction resolvasome RuvABC endonuclease subunit